MKPNETLLDLLLEAQVLDRVPRSGYFLRGVPEPESVAEHSWHVVFLVWTLGAQEENLDLGKALQLALLHDIAEARIGDLPQTVARYFDQGAKARAEQAVVDEMLAPVAEKQRALYEEYSARSSREARFVKVCDKLQLMIKVLAYQQWGAGGLGEFWDNPANFVESEFETTNRLTRELLERHRSWAEVR